MVEESAPADHSRSGGAPSEAPPHRLCDATGIERALESIQRVYGPVVEAAWRLAFALLRSFARVALKRAAFGSAQTPAFACAKLRNERFLAERNSHAGDRAPGAACRRRLGAGGRAPPSSPLS